MGADPQAGSPIRVLVVEDHPNFRLVLRTLLESDDRLIVIDTVGSAGEACGHPHLESVDVVLMDIGLPGTSGIEAMRMLHDLQPTLRVLIMSGSGYEGAAAKAVAAGADAYLEKGGLHRDLIQAIVDAGERSRTSKGREAHRDLNPARLPVPPHPRGS
jgi:DNA-binding NarL/FixJ family response regulator